MRVEKPETRPGWIIDETGALRRETLHHMGRRCRNWDYRGRGTYLITIAAAERGRGKWGQVVAEPASGPAPTARQAVCAEPLAARFMPNALGQIIAGEWANLATAWPGGKLFEPCADGRLLMLAPIAWPYLPGEKPMTRADAQAMNRIAQLIAGSGAAEINYHGANVADVDACVATALRAS